MQKIESEKVTYYGITFEVYKGENKFVGACPFCEFTSEVEAGFFPKFSIKLAAGWVRHHLENYHADRLQ